MLDLFVIFTKGGLVLFYFQGTSQSLTGSVNALVKDLLLVGRSGSTTYDHQGLALKYKLDNEFELVFVVGYQKTLQLSYLDKFLSDIQQEFRDKYKDDLKAFNVSRNFNFDVDFHNLLKNAEEAARREELAPRTMRSFEESQKSKKTVASMIENNNKVAAEKKPAAKGKENTQPAAAAAAAAPAREDLKTTASEGSSEEDSIARNRQNFIKKMQGNTKGVAGKAASTPETKKRVKTARHWDNGGTSKDVPALDFSSKSSANGTHEDDVCTVREDELILRGKMAGDLKGIETESDSDEDLQSTDSSGTDGPSVKPVGGKPVGAGATTTGGSGGSSAVKSHSRIGGIFGAFKSLVGSKALTSADIRPVLDKMKDHLIGKNVAADIADKLCASVATKLEGKVLGTFNGVTSTVKHTLYESCVQILTPHRRVDILRDALECRQNGRPYCITFCGVNGVGKSTNLAKVAFWLVENGFRLLIAACDTFRAGAVEQLRTHVRKLNAIHPPTDHGGRQMVQLYEKGYGKDAAGIAMEAINHARDTKIDIVLVDTAGRMQDNEPLMRALAKLIKVNQPDLVLFVGEALVGNEAVDQLVKFNQALADNSQMDKPRLIDGIVLTKFDTIDDKVGAAISMTYTTGQPIVFVGTGQTYTDLKTLNAKAVVSALLK